MARRGVIARSSVTALLALGLCVPIGQAGADAASTV